MFGRFQRDIVSVADGVLSGRRRARAEARIAADPETRRVLEQHQRVKAALTSLEARAPDRLRRQLVLVQSGGTPPPRRLRVTIAPRVAGPAISACAAAALALVFALTLSAEPTPTAIAAVAHRPALEAPPAPGAQPAVLDRSFGGVQFPNWSAKLGWKDQGARRQTIGGRETDTVYYVRDGHRIAYTVVDGAPLEVGGGARRVRAGATSLQVLHDDAGQTVVTFERNGHTCVVTADMRDDATLVKLAAWRGDGALEF